MSQSQTQSQNTYWIEKLKEVIPAGVNSPVRSCRAMVVNPPVVDSGFQDMITDMDGRSYIDYCGSWGPLIHGHAHPTILEAVSKRMAKGTTFGMTTAIEEQIVRKVIKLVPSVEKMRFVSSGTEATMFALRLARGYTKKPYFIKFNGNYHGSSDFLLVKAGSGVASLPEASSGGILPEAVRHTISLPFNDVEACRRVFHDSTYKNQIAAVIVEPIAGNMGTVPATPEFLQMLREETTNSGALLIFDEVITGFRVALGGAQSLYKITPDLTCFGKIIGGGFPAAAFGGKREIMDQLAPLGPVYQGGTLSGNPVAMEAGLQAIKLLEVDGFYEELARKTALLTVPIKQYIRENKLNACIQEVGSMFTLFFGRHSVSNMEEAQKCDMPLFASFFRYMLEEGIYIPPLQVEAWFVSQAHTDEHLIHTRDVILRFLKR